MNNIPGLLLQLLMHCPTKKLIHDAMITRSATMISCAAPAWTARLTMMETLQVFPINTLLATAVVINSTPVITGIREVLPPAPDGHAIIPCNISSMKKGQRPLTAKMSANWVLTNDWCTPLHPLLSVISEMVIGTGGTKSTPKEMKTRDHNGTNTSNSQKLISPEH